MLYQYVVASTSTMRSALKEKGPSILLALVMFAFLAPVLAQTAVVKKLEIMGGPKGVALVINGDGNFDLSATSTTGTFNLNITNAIYGLKDYSISSFPPGCPIKKITVTEKTATKSITMKITTASDFPITLQTKKKSAQWLVLISRKATPEFIWASVQATTRSDAGAAIAALPNRESKEIAAPKAAPIPQPALKKAEPQIIPVPSAPVAQKKAVPPLPAKPVPILLGDIRQLQQPGVSRVVFVFDKPVSYVVKREGTILGIAFEQVESALSDSMFVPDTASGIRKIQIKKLTKNATPWVKALLTIPRNSTVLTNSVDNQVVATIHTPKTTKLGIWSASGRRNASYSFVQPAPVAPKTTTKTADKQAVAQAAPTLPQADARMNSLKVFFTIKESTILRSDTLNRAADNTVATLNFGSRVFVLSRSPSWVLVRAGTIQGWASANALADSASLTQIQKKRLVSAAVKPINMSDTTRPDLPAIAPKVINGELTSNRVEYVQYGRDPFLPVKQHDPKSNDLASVDNLILVGILYDNFERIALLEDKTNKGRAYALREGEAVKQGHLVRIAQDQVVFLLNEFGISKTFTIKLRKNTKPSGVVDNPAQMNGSNRYRSFIEQGRSMPARQIEPNYEQPPTVR